MSDANKRIDNAGDLPWATVPAMLNGVFAAYADAPALIDGEVALDYRALGEQVAIVSCNLARQHVEPGDMVVIWSQNCWQCVVSVLACWSAGAVVVPLSSRLKALEVLPVLQATKAKLLLTTTECHRRNLPVSLSDHCRDQGRALKDELPHLGAIGIFEGDEHSLSDIPVLTWSALTDPDAQSSVPSPAVEPNDLCEIMFTSGSTGRPKGVMLGQYQTLKIMWDAGRIWTIRHGDRVLIIAPLSHVTGINAGLLAGLMSGATLVLLDIFQPQKALALIEAQAVTCMAGPPAMFKQLLVENAAGKALDSLRKVSILGAPVPSSLIEEIKKETAIEAIFTGYGMTECSSIATTRETDTREVVMTTVGHPMPELEIMVVGPNGEDLSGESSGEIRVRGYGVMRGYLGDDELTSATVTAEGWLRTGDIGEITPEGRVRLLGREKEMYIAFGFNVYPAEVEFLLMQSGLIESVAVVARSNRFSGEEGVAFVVRKPDSGEDSGLILRWAKRNMANYKVPGKVIVVSELPLNTNGKVDKIALKNQLEKG